MANQLVPFEELVQASFQIRAASGGVALEVFALEDVQAGIGDHGRDGIAAEGIEVAGVPLDCLGDLAPGRPHLNPWKEFDWPAIPGYFGRPWFLPILGAYYRMKDLVT